jgi:hypothetical protein
MSIPMVCCMFRLAASSCHTGPKPLYPFKSVKVVESGHTQERSRVDQENFGPHPLHDGQRPFDAAPAKEPFLHKTRDWSHDEAYPTLFP